MLENFPNLRKDIDLQTQETSGVLTAALRHIIIKVLKDIDKQRILKAAREKSNSSYAVDRQ